ncbi:hypothetical protein [Streptomyces sp. NPDC015131]|uniref:hypothetical protein n=1 Tax=Streptomyces sp. NPDC015131 TaxID=3364941 RepID=UPI0036FBD514
MTTPPQFSRPAGQGDMFNAHEHKGRLLLIYPKAYDPQAKTSKGIGPAADADIVVVDATDPTTGQPPVFHDGRIFGNLAKSVRNDVGGQVLGRLDQAMTSSGNEAWVLRDYTDADAAMAGPVHAAFQAGQFKQPSSGMPQQAPPQYDAWAGMNATPAPPPAATPPPAAWQAAGAPSTAPAPAPAAGVEPALADFLRSKGINVTPDMTQDGAMQLAAMFR